MSRFAQTVTTGFSTGDYATVWPVFLGGSDDRYNGWVPAEHGSTADVSYGGREHVLLWEDGDGCASRATHGAPVVARAAMLWGERGRGVVSQMGDLHATLYIGELFDNNMRLF